MSRVLPLALRLAAVPVALAGLALASGCSSSQRKEPAPALQSAEAPAAAAATPNPPAEPAPPSQPAPPPTPTAPAQPAGPAAPPPAAVAIPTVLGLVDAFTEGTPDAAVRAAFRCAIDIANEDAAFKCYAALNIADNRDSDISLLHLRSYQWKVFRQRAPGYVVSEKPFTVKVMRRDPETAPADAKHYKLFLHSRDRDFPAPITLRRDAGRWLIYSNSL